MVPNKVGDIPVTSKAIEMKGGVDEHAPSLNMNPGTLISCNNYLIEEGTGGGYASTKGYERLDGLGKPSDHLSVVLKITQLVTTPVYLGEVIEGATGQATAIADSVTTDVGISVEVTVGIDTFVQGEELYISAVPIGTNKGIATLPPHEDHHQAWDTARAATQPVPGELAVLGLSLFHDKIYAFRKKVGLAEIGLYVSDDILSWVEIDTSANPITYVDQDVHKFEFVVWNFYGATTASPQLNTSEESMYWVDSQNKARYYNVTEGVVLIDNSGMDPEDKPTHVCAKGDYLFLSYTGGSLQHSTIGLPKDWATSPGELGMGKEITALTVGVGASLMIFMTNGISTLVGEVEANWTLKTFSRESGAYSGTPKRLLGTTFFMDDRGLTTLEAVEFFGDYAANSITANFKKTFLLNKDRGTVASVNRELNQYRMYFNNGLGIVVSFTGKELQGATFTNFPISVDVIADGQLSGKQGVTIFASKVVSIDGEDITGYVYLMDSGPNFDGIAIITKAETAYYHYGSPRSWKRFISCMIESQLPSNIDISFKIDYNYHNTTLPTTEWIGAGSDGVVSTTSIYSQSIYGEDVYGAAPIAISLPIYLAGYGTNASFKWITQEMWEEPHNIQNIIVDYRVNRRMV